MRGDKMFFKKKPKYLRFSSNDDTCSIIKSSEIALIQKLNLDNKFCIKVLLKNGYTFISTCETQETRNEDFEKIRKF